MFQLISSSVVEKSLESIQLFLAVDIVAQMF